MRKAFAYEVPLDGIMWADLDLNFFQCLDVKLFIVAPRYGPFLSFRYANVCVRSTRFFLNRGPLVLVGIVALKSDENLRKNLRMGSYLGVERPVWADFGGKIQLKYMCFPVLRECRRVF